MFVEFVHCCWFKFNPCDSETFANHELILSRTVVSSSLVPNYLASIADDGCNLEPDDEITEECEPFTDLGNSVDAQNRRERLAQTNECNKQKLVLYSGDNMLSMRAKLLTIVGHNPAERIKVYNLCNSESRRH